MKRSDTLLILTCIFTITILSKSISAQHMHPRWWSTDGTSSSRGDAPINDECTGAQPQLLVSGATLTFTGDNTGANILEGTPFVVVWEAFTLEACAMIVIDHCVAGSEFTTFLNTVTSGCPDVFTGQITADSSDDCSITFMDLGPGTWYVPVLVDSTETPIGAYSFTISAMPCTPAYCPAEGLSQQTTGSISSISVSNMDLLEITSGLPYSYHSLEMINVGTGAAYEIVITLDDNGAPDEISDERQLLVWIDLDRNGDFNDPGELVWFSTEGNTSNVYTGLINIPSTAQLGATRMRIRLHDMHDGTGYPNEPNNTPCGGSTYGQVHDIPVNIDLGTGIIAEVLSGVILYPNPTVGDLFLAGSASDATTGWIFDATGRLVHGPIDLQQKGGFVHLPLHGRIASGVHYLRIDGEQRSWTYPFIME